MKYLVVLVFALCNVSMSFSQSNFYLAKEIAVKKDIYEKELEISLDSLQAQRKILVDSLKILNKNFNNIWAKDSVEISNELVKIIKTELNSFEEGLPEALNQKRLELEQALFDKQIDLDQIPLQLNGENYSTILDNDIVLLDKNKFTDFLVKDELIDASKDLAQKYSNLAKGEEKKFELFVKAQIDSNYTRDDNFEKVQKEHFLLNLYNQKMEREKYELQKKFLEYLTFRHNIIRDSIIKTLEEKNKYKIKEIKLKYDTIADEYASLDQTYKAIKNGKSIGSNSGFTIQQFRGTNSLDDGKSKLTEIPSIQSLSKLIIDATAQYLVQRAQQEITLSFFDKFKDKINDIEILKEIFPNLSLLLTSQDYFQIPSMGETWIRAVQEDLNSMPNNIYHYISSIDNFKDERNKELYNTFKIVLAIYKLHRQAKHPAEIFPILLLELAKQKDSPVYENLYILNVMTQSLRSTDAGKVWISINELMELNKEEKAIFINLIYNDIIKQYNNNQHLLTKFEDIEDIFTEVLKIASLLNIIQEDLRSLQEENGKNINTIYMRYLGNVYKIINDSFNFYCHLNDNVSSFCLKYGEHIKPILDNSVKMANAFLAKEYAAGFLYVIHTLKQLDLNVVDSKSYRSIATYGNFLVDIVTADSTTQMKDIIAKYSMPNGSYTIKRKSPFSIDLNAYPGLYFAQERSDLAPSFAYGITAPIGFSFTWGGDSGSFSIFIPIVDIGAPFSYRWLNDSAEGLPEDIKISQILSLGAHATWGFKGSPFSLMVGVQHTPQLRAIEDGVNKINENKIYRIGITLAVDIPMFNLMY